MVELEGVVVGCGDLDGVLLVGHEAAPVAQLVAHELGLV